LVTLAQDASPIDTNLTLTEHGTLQPTKLPAEIFGPELRASANQFERREKDLVDPRAKQIHRRSAIHGEDDTNQSD
jgi:hypothetical protein